jgi:branched-subunit amino acid aminotransferase/4-amino-4-deoxychorismate lyase
VLGELADTLEIPLIYRDMHPDELFGASELLLCSTSPCLLPVVSLDGRQIGEGVPGITFQRLMAAWSELVEVDIMAQAAQFSRR